MFFRTRSRHTSSRRPPRRFRLEALESRDCLSTLGVGFQAHTVSYPNVQLSGVVSGPAQGAQVTLSGAVTATVPVNTSGQFNYFGPASGLGLITATATDSAGDSGEYSSSIMHSPPQINSFIAQATGQGKQVDVSGYVGTDTPAGLTVTFAGSAGLDKTCATTDANGHFDLVTTAANLGTVTAVVTDAWGVQSTVATTQLTSRGPQINSITVAATGQGKQVNVSGSVSAQSPAGLTVVFSGSAGVSGSATTNSGGGFSLLTTASQLGTVTAVTTDIWGVSSSPATTNLMVQRPSITGLTVTNLGNGNWQIRGTVYGPDLTEDTVQLSGAISASATPNSSGMFTVIVQMTGSPSGTEYAVATDIWGQTSNQASYTIYS